METEEKIHLLAGHLEEVDVATINKALERAWQAGRREVVKWYEGKRVHYEHGFLPEVLTYKIKREDRQAKLEDWGIEND